LATFPTFGDIFQSFGDFPDVGKDNPLQPKRPENFNVRSHHKELCVLNYMLVFNLIVIIAQRFVM